MTNRDEVLKFGLTFPDTYQDAPFHDPNWQLVRYRENKKAFLWTYIRNEKLCINLKAPIDWAFFWRDMYPAVTPAYHQNKEHWITVILDGTVPDTVLRQMIAESYRLISDSPRKRIFAAVQKIPYGKVATYGQIAKLAGDAKMSRAVGNALHNNPDPKHIPCFRVVNAKGELSGSFAFGGADAQRKLLEAEGITVVDNRVDLSLFQWQNQSLQFDDT